MNIHKLAPLTPFGREGGVHSAAAKSEAVCEITPMRNKISHSSVCVLPLALCVAVATPASAQVVADLVPAQATHCALTAPPAKAGIAVTPGGFVMVFPRNDALTDNFTGCKQLWVVDGDKMMRFATLYFRSGKLAIAIAHDVRDSAGAIAGACALPEGKSLLPKSGRQVSDAACTGFSEDSFYALRLPTWPRSCLTETKAAVCVADPRFE
jgi:hypothetical protein